MMQPRTKRQKEVLDFITRYVTRNGYEPSYQQIAWQLGVTSKAGIARHIQALENQGLISRRRENGSFSLQLHLQRANPDAVCRVEFIDVSAPDAAAGVREQPGLTIPKFLIGSLAPEDVFAFRAADDSMIDKHICEGDIVLLERRSYARRGDIVVALADSKQMFLGQFFQTGSETELRPANADFDVMTFPADQVVVQGIMRGLLRPVPANDP